MKDIMIILVLFFGFSCYKESNQTITSPLDLIPTEKYYSSEILNSNHLKLYGKYKFLSIDNNSGKKGGPGKQDPTYDFLEFNKFGIYGKIKDNVLLETGKIDIIKQDMDVLKIQFIPSTGTDMFNHVWSVRYVGKDSIIMQDVSIGCGTYWHVYQMN